MATSDSPRFVPNVTLAVARGASSPPPEPGNALFFDDFESYADGQDLTATASYGGLRFIADSSQSGTGTKSGRITFNAGGAFGGAIKGVSLVKGQEIWIRFFARFDPGFLFNAGAGFKFLRLRIRNSGGSSLGYLDWYNTGGRTDQGNDTVAWYHRNEGIGGVNFGFGNPDTQNIDAGSWHTYEAHYYLDDVGIDSGGNGVARFWRDNVLLREVTSIGTLVNATDQATDIHHCTFFNQDPESPFQSFDPATSTFAENANSETGSPQDQGYNIDDFQIFTSDSPPTNTDAAGNVFIGGSV